MWCRAREIVTRGTPEGPAVTDIPPTPNTEEYKVKEVSSAETK